jgi:hypothetical protein
MFFILSLFFFLLQNWRTGGRNKCCPRGRAGISEREEVLGKGGRRVNTVQKCVHMYVNGKMIPVETITGTGRGR